MGRQVLLVLAALQQKRGTAYVARESDAPQKNQPMCRTWCRFYLPAKAACRKKGTLSYFRLYNRSINYHLYPELFSWFIVARKAAQVSIIFFEIVVLF